jgi:ATP-dependent Clp protease adapter protein ClpS
MIAPLKLIAVIVALQLLSAAAFVQRHAAPPSARSVHAQDSMRSLTVLHSTATPVAPTKPDIKIDSGATTDEINAREPLWLVRLYNDPMNKREFVARCLVEICGLDDGAAFSVMMNAHQNGLSVICKVGKEVAEMYKQRLQYEGLFVDMIPAEDEGE